MDIEEDKSTVHIWENKVYCQNASSAQFSVLKHKEALIYLSFFQSKA